MKITLEVLKEKGASELCIKYFLCRNGTDFESVELCPVELIKEDKDAIAWFNPLLVYRCIDTLEELREVVEWKIATDNKSDGLHYTFTCCSQLYKQDLELFKKAVKHHFVNHFNLDDVFIFCSEVLALLPELHKQLKNYADSLYALNKILK